MAQRHLNSAYTGVLQAWGLFSFVFAAVPLRSVVLSLEKQKCPFPIGPSSIFHCCLPGTRPTTGPKYSRSTKAYRAEVHLT